jgi:hypothetical protein
MPAVRFSQQLVNQRAQTAGFLALVADTAANNTALATTTDNALLYLQGLMGDAFQLCMEEIQAVCVTNNGLLSDITTNLQAGLVSVPAQDAAGAAPFAAIV